MPALLLLKFKKHLKIKLKISSNQFIEPALLIYVYGHMLKP